MTTVYTGEAEVLRFVGVTLKHAINFYLKTGMKVNRMYTPKNMLEAASRHTGKAYKRGQLKQASADLSELYS